MDPVSVLAAIRSQVDDTHLAPKPILRTEQLKRGLGTDGQFLKLVNGVWKPTSLATADVLSLLADSIDSTHLKAGSVGNTEAGFTFSDYTPVLTAGSVNPTLGTGSTQTGSFMQLGDAIFGHVRIVFGSSGVDPGSGAYFVSLPVTSIVTVVAVGGGYLTDSSTGARANISVATTGDTVSMTVEAAGVVNHASPWTWAAGDALNLFFQYEAS